MDAIELLVIQIYIAACIIPLIVSIMLFRHATTPFVRLLTLLTFKPIITTPLWLLIMSLLPDTGDRIPAPVAVVPILYLPIWFTVEALVPLPLIGIGVTSVLLWSFRSRLRTMPRVALLLILMLDLLRWGSTYLSTLLHGDAINMFTVPAIVMPTIFAVVAWKMRHAGQESHLQPSV